MIRHFQRISNQFFLWSGFLFAVINSFSIQNQIFGFLALLLFLLGSAKIIGPISLPNKKIEIQIGIGIMMTISIVSIIGSIFYYSMPIPKILFVIIITIFTIITSSLNKKAMGLTLPIEMNKYKVSQFLYAGIILIILNLVSWFTLISNTKITEAVRSPWTEINPIALITIAISIFILFGLLNYKKGKSLTIPLFIIIFFSAVSLATLVYPIGFGFDPFIHRATISHIAEFNTITPKPLYYIGQYILELFAIHIFSLDIKTIDTFLVPVLATLFLTTSIFTNLNFYKDKKNYFTALAIFLLPLSIFTITTPQSLAYIFTISLLLLSLPRLRSSQKTISLIPLAILTLATLLTHPIAGIPAFLYFVSLSILTTQSGYPNLKKIALSFLYIVSLLVLPVIFIVQAKLSNLNIVLQFNNLFNFSNLNLTFFLKNNFSAWYDLAYLIIDNSFFIIAILSILGFILAIKKDQLKTQLPFLFSIIWFINFIIMTNVLKFEFLIEYERNNYADRLLILTTIFLIPNVIILLTEMKNHLRNQRKILLTTVGVFLTIFITANIYGAYPRNDNYVRSAGFNVSKIDFDAVYAIDSAGGKSEYIVLANQNVSAASLEAFGFKKYYKNNIFYYPIPTGDRLYQQYLKMTNTNPTREIAIETMNIVNVNKLFFVVNDYWWQSDRIIENAKNEANSWFAVGDNAITIFEYNR